MLEQRKLQRLGHSTLMVSLPKQWVDQLNLKRGDLIGLTTDDEGRLIVHPSLKMLPTGTKLIINADRVEDSLLRRLIIGAYIVGHETIEIRARTNLTLAQINIARSSLNELIGVGIVEQQPKYLVIQSFLDPSKFPIDGLISRLYLIVESMVDLSVRALVEGKNEFAKECINSNAEANKVRSLAVRETLQAVQYKGLALKVGLSDPRNMLGDQLVLKALEEICDISEAIAHGAIKINELGYHDPEINSDIQGLRQQVKKMATLTIEAISKRDPISANSSIIEYDVLAEMEQKVNSKLQERLVSRTSSLASEFRSITQGLLQIGRYYRIAAETMINRAAEGSTELAQVVALDEAS